jgi:apolipoprotein N-acyltransferase
MPWIKEHRILFFPLLSALLLAISRLPLHLGFLSYCGFIPLLYFFDCKPERQHLNKGALVFSTVYTAVALHWINLVTPAGFIGMIILFTLYFMIIFHLNNLLCHKNARWRYFGFILLWLSFEHLQNYGQFAFPWFYTGYSLADYTVLIQPAEIGGVTLISLYVMLTNILIYHYAKTRKNSSLTAVLLIHLFWTGFSSWRYETLQMENTGVKAAIVQVSIPQEIKWSPAFRDSTFDLYDRYMGKTSDSAKLVIFPESAIPGYVLQRYTFRNYVKRIAADHRKNLFTGFPHYEYEEAKDEFLYYNACTLFDSLGKSYPSYHKQILVPFGERIPLLSIIPVLEQVELGQANWEYGSELRYYCHEGLKFTPQICFEVAFPALNARMAQEKPDFIINLTNDAWFHYSAGTYQHAVMTKYRAIETRTHFFRAANTGYSLAVNPRGDIMAKTKLFTREILEENIYTCKGRSIYVRYLYIFPDILVGLCGILLLWTLIKKD